MSLDTYITAAHSGILDVHEDVVTVYDLRNWPVLKLDLFYSLKNEREILDIGLLVSAL
jgi:hypothetical protein